MASALVVVATGAQETEPNGTPGTATVLLAGSELTAAIDPVGDVDLFSIDGVNETWGFVALLDTSASSSSQTATLSALRNDGVTVLQTDTGSWIRGSGVGPQPYVDGGLTHYLRVNEAGDDATVSSYGLRVFQTVVSSLPEVEPNATAATGTPSSFTMNGVTDIDGDVDCFAFHGRADHTPLLALDGDPEGDGSPVDLVLELRDASNAVIASTDRAGAGGREYIESAPLPSDGVYAYCVRPDGPGSGATATYRVALLDRGGLYFPEMSIVTTWVGGDTEATARVGDRVTLRVGLGNDSPVRIPGEVRFSATYPSSCLRVVGTEPPATGEFGETVSWSGVKLDGLDPGEVFTVDVTFMAVGECDDRVRTSISVDYFLSGFGGQATITVAGVNPALLVPILDLITQ